MNQEMWELLIGKYLDSEITPAEQRLLEAEMARNSDARRMLEQLEQIRDQAREVLAAEITEVGLKHEDIFEKAWSCYSQSRSQGPVVSRGRLGFAAGLAAGLVLGVATYFILSHINTNTDSMVIKEPLATNIDNPIDQPIRAARSGQIRMKPRVVRRVNWYNFPDEEGAQLMLEAFNENMVTPAVYQGDL